MTDPLLRADEGCDPDTWLLWDSVWSTEAGMADFALAGSDEPGNRGGLAARAGIATAVVLALFTDARVPAGHPLRYLADGERRGWWGDAVDVQAGAAEGPLGSLLWLLERAPLTVAGRPVAVWAETFAREALAPLLTQGVAGRIAVQAAAKPLDNRLELEIGLFARGGAALYRRRFDLLWRQLA